MFMSTLKVDWPKTLIAWVVTSVVMLAFGYVVAPPQLDFSEGLVLFFVGLIWMAASIVMVATQITLHKLRLIELRHYLFAYPIMVSPILLNLALGRIGMGGMIELSIALAPSVVIFWFLYAHVLQGVPRKASHKPLRLDFRLAFRAALAIGITFFGTLLLNRLVTLLASATLVGEAGYPYALMGDMLTALIVACWGALVHFTMLRSGCSSVTSYMLGFLFFLFGYWLKDIVVLAGAVLAVLLLGATVSPGGSQQALWEQLPFIVHHFLFPAVFITGAPLLWWAYHVVAPRILPARLIA